MKAQRSIRMFGWLLASMVVCGANAATIVVNTVEDELNNDNDCSLREAVEASNLNEPVDACVAGTPSQTGADTITFDPALAGATIQLNLSGADNEDDNATGDLDILDGDLIVAGPATGPGAIVIDAVPGQVPAELATHRIFHVPPTITSFTRLELRDLTLRNGLVQRAGPASGGAVSVEPPQGIGCTPAADPCLRLTRVAVEMSQAISSESEGFGGGVFARMDIGGNTGGAVLIEQSRFENNFAGRGGSTAGGGGVALFLGGESLPGAPFSVTVSSSIFSGNEVSRSNLPLDVESDAGFGGGLLLEASSLSNVTISGNTFDSNEASGRLEAGGGALSTTLQSPTLYDLDISGNSLTTNATFAGQMDAAGGGLDVDASGLNAFDMTGNTIEDNYVFSNSTLALGGGAALNISSSSTPSATLLFNTFVGNSAQGSAEAAGGGLALISQGFTRVIIEDSRFAGNGTLGGLMNAGGGLFSATDFFSRVSNPRLIVRNSEFSENFASTSASGAEVRGAGMNIFTSLERGQATGCSRRRCVFMESVTLSGNFIQAPSGDGLGGGAYVAEGTEFSSVNLTTVQNEVDAASAVGGGIALSTNALFLLNDTIIAQNLGNNASSDCALNGGEFRSNTYNFIGDSSGCGLVADEGDQFGSGTPLDPQLGALAFVGESFSRVHLPLLGSPVLDAGNPFFSPATDQIGTPRPQDGDADGQAIGDIGAAELPAGGLPPAVIDPIPNQTLRVGDQNFERNLNTVFEDPEGGPLTYTASVNDESVVSAMVVGSLLTVSPVSPGSTKVDITAIDGDMLSTSINVTFTVVAANQNLPPQIVASIPDQILAPGGAISSIDLNQVFSDPDGDSLLFEASSSNPDVVQVVVDGAILILEPGINGTAIVTVTALDSAAQSTTIRLKGLARNNPGAAAVDGEAILGGNAGGGCVLASRDNARIDPLMLILVLLSLGTLAARRIKNG